jgi:hypothetical protein
VQVKLAAWSGLVATLIAIAYADRLAAGSPDRNVLYEYSTAFGSILVYAVILGIVLAIAGFDRDLLALRRPRSWPAALGLMLLVLVVVWFAIGALDQLLHGAREQGLTPTGWQPAHAGAYAANFVAVAGVAPVVEELTFRGLGFTLLARYGTVVAILVVGVTFGLAHGLVEGLPELALFGCALAWLRARTDSVLPGIALHATFNAISLVAAVAT